jgi:cupin 2 domain-containing protein
MILTLLRKGGNLMDFTMLGQTNLFTDLQPFGTEEIFTELLRTECMRIERIVSAGQITPPGQWYDQDWDEWVILLSGAAKLEFADGSIHDLKPGDYRLIPAHCCHRVAWTIPHKVSVWLAVHYKSD